jgi:hypothetical protein
MISRVMNLLRSCVPVLCALYAALSIVAAPIAHGDDAPASATTTSDSTADGPHVFWQNDSVAVVIYYCGGELQTEQYIVTDTLRFKGQCLDSEASYAIPRQPAPPEPAVMEPVSRILAVSDLHGDYREFVEFLKQVGVVDDALHWSWGDGHLVIVGDVTDRGDQVTECLWLIYRLQQEAPRAGGGVHMLLGNHELMVMRGDLRYVAEKYMTGIAHRWRISYNDLYGPEMELGRWLRRCNIVLRIGDVLFTHAGTPPRILEQKITLKELNDSARIHMDMPSSAYVISDFPRFLYGGAGPFWYRGYFEASEGRYPQASSDYIDSVLAFTGANSIVVGHSEQEHVLSLYEGRVIAIDVPIDELGGLEGFLYEDKAEYRVKTDGTHVPLD